MNGIPNCVPEYYRSLQDDYDHECEMEMERNEYYRKNKEYRRQKYLDGCNEIRFYPCECENCPHGEEALPDSEIDDIPTMICSKWKTCRVFIGDAKEAFPDVPFEEYCQWREEYVEKLKKEMITYDNNTSYED